MRTGIDQIPRVRRVLSAGRQMLAFAGTFMRPTGPVRTGAQHTWMCTRSRARSMVNTPHATTDPRQRAVVLGSETGLDLSWTATASELGLSWEWSTPEVTPWRSVRSFPSVGLAEGDKRTHCATYLVRADVKKAMEGERG